MLLHAGGIEGAVDLGQELAVAEELSLTIALGFRAAEGELPDIAVALGDFLCTAGLGILQRDVIGFHLLRRQTGTYALTGHADPLLGQATLDHRPLFRRQVLQLAEHEAHVRQRLAIDLHVAGGQLPQPRLQHLRMHQRACQAQHQCQQRQTILHVMTPRNSSPKLEHSLDVNLCFRLQVLP
ncbi:hypothetical protein D3C85_1025930 [compost metagenome]